VYTSSLRHRPGIGFRLNILAPGEHKSVDDLRPVMRGLETVVTGTQTAQLLEVTLSSAYQLECYGMLGSRRPLQLMCVFI
jgi:hypothetical protein